MKSVQEIVRGRSPGERMTAYVQEVSARIDKLFDLDGLARLCREHKTDVDHIVNTVAAKRLNLSVEDIEAALKKEAEP
jgi:hypothetical protein